MSDRRSFLKKAALGGVGLTVANSAMAMSAKSYNRILGSNERLHVAVAGLGRRLGAFTAPIGLKKSNVELLYLCDVMESQRVKGLKAFKEHINYNPKLENDIRKVLNDPKLDLLS